jgi:hypothetical protein
MRYPWALLESFREGGNKKNACTARCEREQEEKYKLQTTKELTTKWEKQGRAASTNCCDLEHGDDSPERMNLRLFYGINEVLMEFHLKSNCSTTI